MECNYSSNSFTFDLPNRQSLRLIADNGLPLKIIPFDNAEKSNSSLISTKAARQFYADVENVKNEIVVLRCLPLNVRNIRLESGREKELKVEEKNKGPSPSKQNVQATTQEDLENIDRSLKNLYCYMKSVRQNSDLPLNLTHFLNILCRLQDIRDTFRDFKESTKMVEPVPKGKESKASKKNGGKESDIKEAKSPSKSNKKGGCFGCGSKKKKPKEDEGPKMEELPALLPCVVVPDAISEQEQQTSSALVKVQSNKNLYEIQICRKGKKGCENMNSQKKENSEKPEDIYKNMKTKDTKAQLSDYKAESTKNKPQMNFEGEQRNRNDCVEKAIQTEEQEKGKAGKDKKAEKSKKENDKNLDKKKGKNEEAKKTEKPNSKEKNKDKKNLPTIKVTEKSATSGKLQPQSKSFCETCYGKEVPIVKQDLAKELKKAAGHRRGTVFLKISAVDEDLYHIQLSTSANSNVGCVFVTGEAMKEANKERALDEYITLCITTSTSSLPNVKNWVNYPFELCDR